MADYASAGGFVQFDVVEKEANNQEIREFTIRALGSQKLIKVTLWPEFAHVPVSKGDFVVVDGKFNSSLGQGKDGSPREYLSISASMLTVLPGEERAQRDVVQRGAQAKTDEPLF